MICSYKILRYGYSYTLNLQIGNLKVKLQYRSVLVINAPPSAKPDWTILKGWKILKGE
jgi:hypothetical protein